MCGLPVERICADPRCGKRWAPVGSNPWNFKCVFCDDPDEDCEDLPYRHAEPPLTYRDHLCDGCTRRRFARRKHRHAGRKKVQEYLRKRDREALNWLLRLR